MTKEYIMKHWKLHFSKTKVFTPISIWVHKAPKKSSIQWRDFPFHEPPFPKKIPLKGFPYIEVIIFNFSFYFASSYEILHCIEVFNQKNLPSTKELIQTSSTTYSGYNHWLATLPGNLKSWKKRKKITKVLQKVLDEIKKE